MYSASFLAWGWIPDRAKRVALADQRLGRFWRRPRSPWLALRSPSSLRAALVAWRISLVASSAGALASIGRFTAFTLTSAANVRALGMAEVVFSYLVSHRFMREKLASAEQAGLGLVLAGVVALAFSFDGCTRVWRCHLKSLPVIPAWSYTGLEAAAYDDGVALEDRPCMQDPAFHTLLYRYFFFGWLFEDACRGNVFERAAAWRHNQRQARWLPTYMRRWLWLGVLLYGLGSLAELMLHAPAFSAFFYVQCALSVPINAVIGVAWLGLKALPEPL